MHPRLLLAVVLFFATSLCTQLDAGEAEGFAAQLVAAERLHQEGSYALALERLQQARLGEIPAAQRRRVALLVADARWRAHVSSDNDDDSALDQARTELIALIDEPSSAAGHDEIWAQAQESLAISYWRNHQQTWDEAWPHFEAALDWWAGSSDLARARSRYLALIDRIAQPVTDRETSYIEMQLPLEVLERALSIANNDEERGYLHYLSALAADNLLSNESHHDQRLHRRIVEELQAVIALGKASKWYGDALFDYGEHVAGHGLPLKRDGRWTTVPGNRAALDSFRLLTSTFAKGAHRRVDAAERRIALITGLELDLDITRAFVPGSLIAYDLRWRNLERIDLSLHRIDLLRQSADAIGGDSTELKTTIDLTNIAPLHSWKHEAAESAEYEEHHASLRLEQPVPTGAYILRAQARGLESRALLLVSDLTSIVVTGKDGALVYVCRVDDGSPVAGATVQVRQRRGERAQHEWVTTALTTGADGLCRAPVVKTESSYQDILVLATSGDQQCFTLTGQNYSEQNSPVRIHAYTDRSAYRPGDTVQWKAIMRRDQQGRLVTLAGTTLTYVISDPEGGPVAKGEATLNAFGSCWGKVALALGAPLGEYTITFQHDDEHEIGSATLFRVEEYKLPEFAVGVRTQGADGKPKTYRKGETVECTITADYYFGGPVADAKVDVRIFVERYDAWWRRPSPFPWLEEPHEDYGSDGDEVSRQFLTTDAAGRATLRFPAPRSGPDLSYRIEARLTDSSRREVIGSGEVKVTSQHYFIALDSPRGIYRPGEKAIARIHAYDANTQPLAVTGHLTVSRQWWDETWLSPEGKSLDRAALAAAGIDPRARLAAGEFWRCTFRGTREEEIFEQEVTTAANGDANVEFVPPRVGTYRMVYDGSDEDGNAITAEEVVLVADRDDAGARASDHGLSLAVDSHNAREGDTLVAVVTMPRPGAWMLVGSDADNLDGMRLIHLAGTSKRLEFPLGERSVPNVHLHAASVFARRYHQTSTAIAVAPRAGSLTVDLVADQPQYGPRQEATWSLKVSDEEGKPVRAEVSLAVADEATFAIQEDFAGDPRTGFFSNPTYREGLRTTSGLAQRAQVKLIEHADYGLIDEHDLAERLGEKAGPPEEADPDNQYEDEVTTTEAFGLKEDVSRGFSLFSMADSAPKPKPPAGGPAVQVRSDFRSTVLWQPDLLTDAQGKGNAKLTFGDALTTWRATARVATAGNQFGMAVVKVRTTQPLIARLQAPRFFVVGDRVVVSLVVSNTSDQVQVVTPSLIAEGLVLNGVLRAGVPVAGAAPAVTVPAHGDARVDWQVTAQAPGTATLTVEARGQGAADAMRLSYPVHQHGIDKLLASAGKLRDGPLTLTLDLPAARAATTLTLQVAPSLATTMLDALPYLIDYPYGCTEQTMSRFLPTVIVARTLAKLGLDPEVAMARTFGGIEAASAARLHPKGRKHLESMAQMSREGLERLADFQHEDGGWGWWKHDRDDPWMTAYVVWGLTLAEEAEVEIEQDLAYRGARWLDTHLVKLAGEPDLQAWALHAIAVEAGESAADSYAQEPRWVAAFTNLWERRDQLNAFGRALLALCAHHFGEKEKSLALVRALENGVRRDRDPASAPALGQPAAAGAQALATAHWGGDGAGGRWSNSPIETTAFVLRALLAIEPANPLVDASATWLIQNRRGAQWTNTRDSAMVVLALSQYLAVTGEVAGEVAYELTVNGTSVAKRTLSVDEALAAPTRVQVPAALVRDGANHITLKRTAGTGPLYLGAQAAFFSQEVPVTPAGNQVFVRRQYLRLAGKPTLLKGATYERIPLNDQERITSGERVEVVLTIEVKNDYEYLLFEDLKPAGFEAVDLLSGADLHARELRADAISRRATDPLAALNANDSDYTPRTAWIHRELRDRQVALFISKLPQGVWEVRYQLRAESPGTFHALPVLAHAMYVPEIRGNSAEVRVVIEDRKD